MGVGKLLEEYKTLEAELRTEKEKVQPLENKLAAIREQLNDLGVKSENTFIHDDCGGTIATFEDGSESVDICLKCDTRGQIESRYDSEGVGRAKFA